MMRDLNSGEELSKRRRVDKLVSSVNSTIQPTDVGMFDVSRMIERARTNAIFNSHIVSCEWEIGNHRRETESVNLKRT